MLSDTDLCVMCGMCLPLCPTYQLYQNETESPRGRIALMQAIDRKKIQPTAAALLHIDHCLGCLNCESICPSMVPFGNLMDTFRSQFASSIRKSFISKQLLKHARKPDGLNKLTKAVNHPALKPVLKPMLNLTSRLTGVTLPTADTTDLPRLKVLYPAGFLRNNATRPRKVSLFTGCTGKSIDTTSIQCATTLLNQLGFDVHIPPQQYCCGAMHQHNGQLDVATELLQHNTEQFLQTDAQTILFFSPACGAQLLKDSKKHKPSVQDVRTFIYEQLLLHPLKFSPATQPIALHESCSHRNMLKLKSANQNLLQLVPDLQITESAQPTLCCGAGGLQAFNYPQQADALLQAKLSSFDWSQTNILISDNIGCTVHMKSAISTYNPELEILHPVSFLARQLLPDSK